MNHQTPTACTAPSLPTLVTREHLSVKAVAELADATTSAGVHKASQKSTKGSMPADVRKKTKTKDQLQELMRTEVLAKDEDDSITEPVVISRRKAELEAANERLQQTAQNFSLEWKAAMIHAVKIKQQTMNNSSSGLPTKANDLEDFLLKTQEGLVLLKDLPNRRHRQWKDVYERYGYKHPSIGEVDGDLEHPIQGAKKRISSTAPQWLRELIPKLLKLNRQIAATTHCALTKTRLSVNHDSEQKSTCEVPFAHFPALIKQRASAVETHHRLNHTLVSASETAVVDLVRVEDVNPLMQFTHLKHQHAIVLERFCTRLKWLPTSHHTYLRQRMLAIAHQQKAKNTPQPSSAARYNDNGNHLHCPLFIMKTPHFTAELKTLAQKYFLAIPGGFDTGESPSSVGDFQILKQEAFNLLAANLSSPLPADNCDGTFEIGLDPLVHTYIGGSRWDLIQRGFLGEYDLSQEYSKAIRDDSHSDRKIDTLLANEWELLGIYDAEYLSTRLEAVSAAHMDRAKVDVSKGEQLLAKDCHLSRIQAAVGSEAGLDDNLPFENPNVVLPNTRNSEALYSLYVLRVCSCREKRLSLLRLLNYLHFIQLCQGGSSTHTEVGPKNSPDKQSPIHRTTYFSKPADKSIPEVEKNPWLTRKCSKTGDYIVIRQEMNAQQQQDEEAGSNGDNIYDGSHEFVFASARRDLEVLELQMLRIASIFIFKQEYDSLPTSRKQHSNHEEDDFTNWGNTVTPIDRLQVLRDIYDCEVAFQQAKLQLVEELLDGGLQFVPRKRDIDELGFSATLRESQTDPFQNIIMPLMQRRPLVDFSHAYFFESYATETILLELQTNLVQQMRQHFQLLEWCPLQMFAVKDGENDVDGQYQWVCQKILGARAIVQLCSIQRELLCESDEKWFSPTSVSEYHALQHALLEQTLVIWSLIIKLELPGRAIRSLERNACNLLHGSGWQLVLSPQLLSDVSQMLHDTYPTRTLLEWLAEALKLESWRHRLAKSVYTAHLLERIHQSQFNFVKQTDTVPGGDQTRHLNNCNLFFDFAKCDSDRLLQSIAVELETLPFQTTDDLPESNATTSKAGRDENKSVSEWVHDQLIAPLCDAASSDESHPENNEAATARMRSETWRRSLLELQQHYVLFLEVAVKYQDKVGTDVFEFAASYPYVYMASTFSPTLSDEGTSIAVDITTVRTKYAKQITDKMAEEMQSNCFPYWKRLEDIKQHMQEHYTSEPKGSEDGVKCAFVPRRVDMSACSHFLDNESCQPRLLTTINQHLQRLRNEKKLMRDLGPTATSKCAFTPHSTHYSDPSDVINNIANFDEDQTSGLMKWLTVKLHQLKVDLQIHDRPKADQLPISCISPPASSQRATRAHNTGVSPPVRDETSFETQWLLQTIPSFRYLLKAFATTANYERLPRDSSTGVASAHAARLQEQREETLRLLLSIVQAFSCTLDLLRIRSGSRFTRPQQITLKGGQYRLQVTSGTGFTRLERWQVQFHRDIRQLLDQLANDFSADATTAISDLFVIHPERLQNQHNATRMREELCSGLHEANAFLMRTLLCATNFAVMQTFQKDAGVRVQKQRQRLLAFQSNLKSLMVAIPAKVDISAGGQHESTGVNKDRGEVPSSTAMRHLLLEAERVFFCEARLGDRDREWHAFNDAVNKHNLRDSVYISGLAQLLELHRVYIDEISRAIMLADRDNISLKILQSDAENKALDALEDLWQRFNLPAWDSPLVEGVSLSSGRSTPAIAGGNLYMKKRLLSLELGTESPSNSILSSILSAKEFSYAQRSLQMGTNVAPAHNTNMLGLSPATCIDHQVLYLQLSLELTWVNADTKALGDQHMGFLFYRKTLRRNQRAQATSHKSPRTSQALEAQSCVTPSSLLSTLTKYFCGGEVHADKTQPDIFPESTPPLSEQQGIPASFVVPAQEMACFLHDITAQCVEHSRKQLDLHELSIQQLHDKCQAIISDGQKIQTECAKVKLEERIRREAFAVDHAFHLYFEVEALRKQVAAMEAHKELDRQILRCELDAEYADKLQSMHVELLCKQQKFAEYRTAMQRDLQMVMQNAHSQFVGHLLDFPGSSPMKAKTSLTSLLRGQQDIAKMKSENVSLKQALLKIQALGDMQQQIHNAAQERESVLTQRYATAEALQRNEIDQLQAYVKQLEGSVNKLSQEKTYFQVKWNHVQKQMDEASQRRREAKIHALSASHIRGPPTPETLADEMDNFFPAPTLKGVGPENDTDDIHENDRFGRPRTPGAGTPSSVADARGKQELRRLESHYLNSTRHYQNEIRRLQQQLSRESREKTAIAQQMTELKKREQSISLQLQQEFSSTPRRVQSASPRMTLKVQNSGAVPPDRMAPPKRPNSSFSPRTSLLRAQVAGDQLQQIAASSNNSSRPSTANSTSTPRKFQVIKRDTNNLVGGVLGVPNSFSLREPLPYR